MKQGPGELMADWSKSSIHRRTRSRNSTTSFWPAVDDARTSSAPSSRAFLISWHSTTHTWPTCHTTQLPLQHRPRELSCSSETPSHSPAQLFDTVYIYSDDDLCRSWEFPVEHGSRLLLVHVWRRLPRRQRTVAQAATTTTTRQHSLPWRRRLPRRQHTVTQAATTTTTRQHSSPWRRTLLQHTQSETRNKTQLKDITSLSFPATTSHYCVLHYFEVSGQQVFLQKRPKTDVQSANKQTCCRTITPF